MHVISWPSLSEITMHFLAWSLTIVPVPLVSRFMALFLNGRSAETLQGILEEPIEIERIGPVKHLLRFQDNRLFPAFHASGAPKKTGGPLTARAPGEDR
jgi:hypothetical protein